MILTEGRHYSGRQRQLLIVLALGLNVICLGSLIFGAYVSWQPPHFMTIQVGNDEIVFEVDRSPDCPNGVPGLCDIRGSGLVYLSVWRYSWTNPTVHTARPLFAIPVAP